MTYLASHTCEDLEKYPQTNAPIRIIGIIQKVSTYNSKNGEMAFIDIKDSTGFFKGAVCFADIWATNKVNLYKNNKVLLSGVRKFDRNTKKVSFIINNVNQI